MGGETDLQHTTQQGHDHETLHNKRQFSWYNIFMVATMSWGAFGYGYTNAVIGPTLGIFLFLVCRAVSTCIHLRKCHGHFELHDADEKWNCQPSRVLFNILTSRREVMLRR